MGLIMKKWVKRLISISLATFICLTNTLSDLTVVVKAQEGSETLLINNVEASGIEIEYGQPLNLSVAGYQGEGTITFQYGTAQQVDDEDWQSITSGNCALLPGKYYFNYAVTENETTRFDKTCLKYEVTIVKGTLAAPSGLAWNGSTITWQPVTTTNKGGLIQANSVKEYTINIYKNASLIKTENSSNTQLDISNQIVSNTNFNNGTYTFDVQAVVSTTGSTYYQASEKSSTSSSYIVPLVTLVGDDGISSLTPSTSFLLLPGNESYNSKNISANIKSAYSFKNWTAEGVSFDNSNSKDAKVTINNNYQGAATLNVYAHTTDKTLPVVEDIAGKDNEKLTIVAYDNETGIVEYAFSTAETAENVENAQWKETAVAIKEATTFTHTLDAGGIYYFYAKDGDGNIVQSAPIEVSEVTYHNYYRDDTTTDKVSYMIGDASGYILETPASPGYNFKGWMINEETITSIEHDVVNGISLMAKWEKQTIELAQLENISKTYDGLSSALTAQLMIPTTGIASYQWYKNGEILPEKTTSTLEVKDVNDSGDYYVTITVSDINGNILNTDTSNTATVSIEKADLLLKVETVNVVYGDDIPSLALTYQGFVNGEDETYITVGTVSTTYQKGDNVGTYPIYVEGFQSDNYDIVTDLGVVNVQAKTEGIEYRFAVEGIEYTFALETEYKPEVVVSCEGNPLVLDTDYVVEYIDNSKAGEAKAKITLKGNYAGEETLFFNINKADYISQATIDDWKYGDNGKTPNVTYNPENGDIIYYYAPKGTTNFSLNKPTEAGEYVIYGIISETANYNEITTETYDFEIKKRVINLKAADATWYYDGGQHSDGSYQQTGDGFVKGQGFKSVIVTGNVKEVTGEQGVENVIEYTLNSGTNPDNYTITVTNGKLVVLSVALTIPSGASWNKNNIGTVNWIAVSKSDLVTQYKLQLYAYDGSEYLAVGDPVTTTDTKYDFAGAIRTYAAASALEGKAYSYFFTIQSIAYGGKDAVYYFDSPVSEYIGEIFTAYINSSASDNVEYIKINDSIEPYVLLAGESVQVSAKGNKGYTPNWNSLNNSELSFSNNILYLFTGLFTYQRVSNLNFSSTTTRSIICETLSVSTRDASPQINSFRGENLEDYSGVKFTFEVSDGVDIAAWMITTNENTPSKSDSAWITTGVTGDNDTNYNGTYTVNQKGTYYIYVKDSSGNIASYYTYIYDEDGNEISTKTSYAVYEVILNAGTGTGDDVHLYKLENTGLVIPECTFTSAGSAFQNWYGTTGIYEDKGIYSENSDETLVAYWTNVKYTYKVNYFYMDLEGKYSETADDTKTFEAVYGLTVDSSATSIQQNKVGFTLDQSAGHVSSITIDQQGKEINIYYSRNKYTIKYRYTFPGNNEETVDEATYYYDADLSNAFLDKDKPSFDGYDFIGWDFGGSGSQPDKMPYQDIEVTGYFVAAPGVYYIYTYTQNYQEDINGNYIPSDTYTLMDGYITGNCLNDEEITYSIHDSFAYTGFTASKVAYSYGSVAGVTVPSGAGESITAKAYATDDDHILYINVYYTRDYHEVKLNVWQGPVGENLIYNHTWEVLYGAPVDMVSMASYNSDNWPAENEYMLASYKDYSTGEPVSIMPAGDVTITRQFVKRTIGTYLLEIWIENTRQDDFYDMKSFTYYGNVGATATVGTDSSYTINYLNFGNSIPYLSYYHEKIIDDSNISEISGNGLDTSMVSTDSIEITDTNNGEEMQILRVFLEKNTVTTTITYYYNDLSNSLNNRFAEVKKKAKWGQQKYKDEHLAFFDSIEGGSFQESYSSMTLFGNIDGISPDLYDFRNNNYVVSMNGSSISTINFKKAEELNNVYNGVYNYTNNYINVYYSKVDPLQQHYVSMGYNASGLNHGDNEFVPLTYQYQGHTYQVRLANEAMFYEDCQFIPGTGFETYPGAGYLNAEDTEIDGGHYSYTVDDSNLKNEYSHISGTDYYYDDNYIYIANASNPFYAGNRAIYTFPTTEIGYKDVTDYLDNYKNTWSEDAYAQGASVSNRSFNSILYDNIQWTITMRNGRTHILYYTVTGNVCDQHVYPEGNTVKLASIGCKHNVFADIAGYHIVWYDDSAFTRKTDHDIKMNDDVILYGRYEKDVYTSYYYAYYELPDPIVLSGKTYNYVTEEDVTKLASLLETDTNENVTTYLYDGEVVMISEAFQTESFTEIVMNYADYKKDGFKYSTTNPNNTTAGYAQVEGIALRAYFERDTYGLTVNSNIPDANSLSYVYPHGKKVLLEALTRDGYDFAGWKITKNGEEYTDETHLEDGDKNYSFKLPMFNLVADAYWTPAYFDQTVIHYYQMNGSSFDTSAINNLGNEISDDVLISLEGGSPITGKVYDGGAVSYQVEDKIYYYATSTLEEGVYNVFVEDLVFVKEKVSLLQETQTAVSSLVNAVDNYDFAFAHYKDNNATLTLTDGNFTNDYGMILEYFYTIDTNIKIDISSKLINADSEDISVTLLGARNYFYGETASLFASVSLGYSFVGWYKASDVVDEDGKLLEGLDFTSEDLVALSTETNYVFKAKNTENYVAIISADAVATPNIIISGISQLNYGYIPTQQTKVTAQITFDNDASSSNYVRSYQWYMNGEKITEGGNSATYLIPAGLEADEYDFTCQVTIARRDNGQSKEYTSEIHKLLVATKIMSVSSTAYVGTYDAKYHEINLTVSNPSSSSDYEIYYALEELTKDNYATIGNNAHPQIKDVKMTDGKVDNYTVYYYIKSLNDNYLDCSGSNTILINPAPLSLEVGGATFHKTYDSYAEVKGSVSQEGTDLYNLVHNKEIYSIRGLMGEDELGNVYFIYVDAIYNSLHTDQANALTLTDIVLINDDYVPDTNYYFPEHYSLVLSAYIDKLKIELDWQDDEFVYDGNSHNPTATIISTLPDNDIGHLTLAYEGQQVNAGNYTGTAKIISTSSDTYTSDFALINNTQPYTIAKREVTITPKDSEVVYDGEDHTIKEFDFAEGSNELVEGQIFEDTKAYYMEDGQKKFYVSQTGSQEYMAENAKIIITETQEDVTDNYDIAYSTGNLTITPKPIVFQGVKGVDKEFDGTDSATIDSSELYFEGLVGEDDPGLDVTKLSGSFLEFTAGENKPIALEFIEGFITNPNYVVDKDNSQKQTTANITQATITVTAKNIDTIYGKVPEYESEFTGFMEDDTQDVIRNKDQIIYRISSEELEEWTLENTYEFTTEIEVGTYYIYPFIDALQADNYSFKAIKGQLEVTPREIAVKPVEGNDPKGNKIAFITKVYDGTTKADIAREMYEYTTVEGNSNSGVINDDIINLTCTSSFNTKDVLTANIVKATALEIDNPNYTLVTEEMNIDGQITPKALQVTANNISETYGITNNPTYTVKYSGFVAGENKSVLSGTLSLACGYDHAIADNRKVGTYDIIASGLTSDNYDITFVKGTLTINKATIKVYPTAEKSYNDATIVNMATQAATRRYGGDSIPSFGYDFAASELKYDDEKSVVTGSVTYTHSLTQNAASLINNVPGDYTVTPVVTNLKADNYKFTATAGTLKITKYVIKVSGVTCDSKVYDGTKAVEASQFDYSAVVYDGMLELDQQYFAAHPTEKPITATGQYVDSNVANSIPINLTITLNSYLASRCELSDESQTTTSAPITKRPLLIKAEDKSTKYGVKAPQYTVSYGKTTTVSGGTVQKSGLVTGDSADGSNVTIECEYDHTAYDNAGEYPITVKDFVSGSGIQANNYEPVYQAGTLTVSKVKLEAPKSKWSETTPGLITWIQVSNLGLVEPGDYVVTLVKNGTDLPASITTVDSHNTLEVNYADLIHQNGPGKYTVKIYPEASTENNADYINVLKLGDTSTSSPLYATNVSFVYNNDQITNAGKNTIAINEKATTTMIAGEANIPIAAEFVNGTGYIVESVTANSSLLVLDEKTLPLTASDSYSNNVSLSNTLNNANPITITLKLKATPATLSVLVTPRPGADQAKATFGYSTAEAPTLTATASVVDDNVTTEGYTYTYEWTLKDITTVLDSQKFENQTSNESHWTIKNGLNANLLDTYYVIQCKVRATRLDNGQYVDADTNYSYKNTKSYVTNITITRASFSAKAQIDNWMYGETRKVPSIGNFIPSTITNIEHPGINDVVYRYVLKSVYDLDHATTAWQETQPTNAGVYYMVAYIPESTNYNAFTTPLVSFTISKNKLADPSNLAMTANGTASYGLATWDAVSGYQENDGTDSESEVGVSYTVRLYRQKDDGAYEIDSNNYELVNTYSDLTETQHDLLANMQNQGTYIYSVQAMDVEGTGLDNCDASQEIYSDKYVVGGSIAIYDNGEEKDSGYAREYNGQDISLVASLNFTTEETITYQWFKDGEELSGKTEGTLLARYVSDTGSYDCVITAGGSIFTAAAAIEINPTAITLVSGNDSKIYDGTPLTKDLYWVNETSPEIDNETNNPVSTFTNVASSLTTLIDHLGNTVSNVAVTGSETKNTYASIKNNTLDISSMIITEGTTVVYGSSSTVGQNYEVSTVLGTLKVTARSIAATAGTDTKVYDGTPLTCTSGVLKDGVTEATYDFDLSETVTYAVTNDVFTISMSSTITTYAQGTNGVIDNVISGITVKNAAKEDVTDCYLFTYETGTLKITKRSITITASSTTRDYNGLALTDGEFTVDEAYGLAAGDNATVVNQGTITNVGQVENTVSSVTIKNSSDVDVTSSYEISTAKGALKVEPLDINKENKVVAVVADISDYIYDGTAKIPSTDGKLVVKADLTKAPVAGTNSAATMVLNSDYTVAYSNNINAGQATVTITGKGNYKGSYDKTYTIKPLPVVLEWSTDAFTYDKTAKTITATITNIKNNASKSSSLDEVFVATYQENIKTNASTYQAKALTLGGSDATNYTLEGGTGISKAWTIAPKDVTIKWHIDSECKIPYTKAFEYNGEAFMVYPDVVEKEDGDTFTYKYSEGETHNASDIGEYQAIVEELGNANYKLLRKDNVITETATLDWEIANLMTDARAVISGTAGSNGWFISNVIVTAPNGYLISETYLGSYTDSYVISIEGESNIEYYLKRISDGAYTAKICEAIYLNKMVASVKVDLNNPTGKLKFKNSVFTTLNNPAAMTLFSKGVASLSIESNDTNEGSGIDKVYYASANALTNPASITSWKAYTYINLIAPTKKYVYAKIVDMAGRTTYINSYGIVVFTDSQSDSETVEYTRTSKLDKVVTISSNKNTVKGIKLGENVLTEGVDYKLKYQDGNKTVNVTLTKTYLETLAASDEGYQLDVSYYPYGVTDEVSTTSLPADEKGNILAYADNQIPSQTPIIVNISKAQPTIELTDNQTKTYDGNATNDMSYVVKYPYQTKDSTSAHAEYYLIGADGVTREAVDGKPWRAGNYVVVVTRDADDNYLEASSELEFTIATKKLVVKGQSASKVYDGTPLTQPAYEYLDSTGLAAGDSAIVTMSEESTITNKGSQKNIVDTVVIKRSEVDVTDCYDITKVDDDRAGVLTITLAAVTITVNDASKIYGDEDQTFTIKSVTGLIDENDLGTISVIRLNKETDKDAGKYPDVLDAIYTDNPNYTVTVVKGDLTINPRPVIFAWDYDSFFYTALPHTVSATVTNKIGDDTFSLSYKDSNIAKAVGDYIATVYELGNSNYTLVGATNVTHNYSISYNADGIAKVTGSTRNGYQEDSNEWYNTTVVLIPQEGFLISIDETNWEESISYDKTKVHHEKYYLKEISTGYVTEAKYADFNQDIDAPKVVINLPRTQFKQLFNKVKYEYFFKDSAKASIIANDQTEASGVDSIEYQVVDKGDSFDENGEWILGDKLVLQADRECVIYARVYDKAGNSIIISTDGLVIFKDSTSTTSELVYTKTTNEDQGITINLNENTIRAIKLNGTTLTKGKDYTVSGNKIILDGKYLQGLSAKEYNVVITVNPLGETYTGKGDGNAPRAITVKLTVEKLPGSVTITKMDSKDDDGKPVSQPEYQYVGDGDIVIEYKKASEPDSAYSTKAPSDAGEYVVRVTLLESENYTGASDAKSFTIIPNKSPIVEEDNCYIHWIMVIAWAGYLLISLLTAKRKKKEPEEQEKAMKKSKNTRLVTSAIYVALMAILTYLGTCKYDLPVAVVSSVATLATIYATYKHKFKDDDQEAQQA